MNNQQNQIKILVIGPQMSGKSSIVNYICERQETSSEYQPTAGVRILEVEKEAPVHPKHPIQEKVLVELWDLSGDPKYERCWPLAQENTLGVILVYNVDNTQHTAALEQWVSNFPKKLKIHASMCMGFAHHLSGNKITTKAKQPKGLTSLTLYDTSLQEASTTIGPAFEKFFNNLMINYYNKQDNEDNILLRK